MANQAATFVSSEINDLGNAPQVIVAITRRRGAEFTEIGFFLVDCGCLGIKDAWFQKMASNEIDDVISDLFPDGYLKKSGAWGRKFVESARDYAQTLGFRPAADYKKAARVLGGIQADNCDEEFEFGIEGTPLYIQSPADSIEKAERIVANLRSRCGEDGFRFFLAVNDLEDRVSEVLEMAESGKIPSAEAGITKLLSKNPESAFVQYAAGTIRALQDDPEEALKHFDEAIRLDPEMGPAWYNKGIAHKKLLEITPMAIALQRAVSANGGHNEYIDEANKLIETVREMAEKDFGLDLDTYLKSGEIYDQAWEAMNQEEWEDGLHLMREALRINPRSYQSYGNIGVCLIQLNRREEAKEACKKALDLNPDYEPAQTNLALLEKAGESTAVPLSRIKIINSKRRIRLGGS